MLAFKDCQRYDLDAQADKGDNIDRGYIRTSCRDETTSIRWSYTDEHTGYII